VVSVRRGKPNPNGIQEERGKRNDRTDDRIAAKRRSTAPVRAKQRTLQPLSRTDPVPQSMKISSEVFPSRMVWSDLPPGTPNRVNATLRVNRTPTTKVVREKSLIRSFRSVIKRFRRNQKTPKEKSAQRVGEAKFKRRERTVRSASGTGFILKRGAAPISARAKHDR